ncbi:RNase A-like domain-containing protein [Streptomyces niveus]|uniref:RNase A-like domain-containing protein n=1 Tax=Streptomyces niveus TaxID=193462 RepID=UPI003447A83B
MDKHVGKTDIQLAMRLRGQPTIDAASSFVDLPQAQKMTQAVMEDVGPPSNSGQPNAGVNNSAKITAWLSRPRKDTSILRLDPVEFQHVTGRTVEASNPSTRHALDTRSATAVLKYKNGLVPPYVVYASMPSLP